MSEKIIYEALDWIKSNIGFIDYVEFPEEYQKLFLELLEKQIHKEI